MSNISVVEVSDKEVLNVWENSPHATVFTHPLVLKKMAYQVRWFLAKKGNESLCAWPICNKNEQPYIPLFSYFVGPIWSKNGWNMPNHRLLATRLEVYESFIRTFEHYFDGFVSSLPLGISDVRAFDWWNYHDPSKPRIKILPRYTAQITALSKDYQLLAGYRELRRRELKRIEKAQRYILTEDLSPDITYELYISTMSRQGNFIDKNIRQEIELLHKLVSDGYGFFTVINDTAVSNKVAYLAIILRAAKISNLVLNLTNDEYRGSGVSAYGVHKSIQKAIQLGDNTFDFNGANSPQRGDDKHSYGAEEKLYFEIHYGK